MTRKVEVILIVRDSNELGAVVTDIWCKEKVPLHDVAQKFLGIIEEAEF